jgi:hypothetical protein
LQFNRSLFRVGWLHRNFPSTNILLLRRPIDVWKSMLSFRNDCFVSVFCIVLGQNRSKEPLKHLPDWVPIPFHAGRTIEDDYAFYGPIAIQNRARLYPDFYDSYVTSIVYAAPFCDCIIDINEVTMNPAARELTEQRLRELGLNISLDDCSVPSTAAPNSEDREWPPYEEFARKFLAHSLPRHISIPDSIFRRHQPLLGEYFRNLMLEFTNRHSPGALRISEIFRRNSGTNHMDGARLLRVDRPEPAARKLADALRGNSKAELWRDWARSQIACGNRVLGDLGLDQANRFGLNAGVNA